MAVLTLSLAGAGLINPVNQTLSAGDTTRMLAAYIKRLQAQGNPSPTPQQCFNYMAAQMKAVIINEVRNQEQRDAQSAITSIVMA